MTDLPAGHHIRVAALVYNEAGEILCVRHFNRGLPFWTLPGGAPKDGESLATAVMREIAEETGCGVALKGIVGVGSRCVERWAPAKIEVFFEAQITAHSVPKAHVGESIIDVRFFKPHQIPDDFRPREVLALVNSTAFVSHIELAVEDQV